MGGDLHEGMVFDEHGGDGLRRRKLPHHLIGGRVLPASPEEFEVVVALGESEKSE